MLIFLRRVRSRSYITSCTCIHTLMPTLTVHAIKIKSWETPCGVWKGFLYKCISLEIFLREEGY